MLHVEHFFLASSTDCLEELERHTLHTKLSGSRSKDRCILCCLLAIIWPLQRRVICSLLAGGFRFDRHRVSVGKNLQTQREQIRASVPGGVVKLTFRLLLVESAATFDNSRTFLLSESDQLGLNDRFRQSFRARVELICGYGPGIRNPVSQEVWF